MKRVFTITTLAFIVWMSVSVAVAAGAYPTKSVRVIVPWPPGGSNDISGRIIAQKLSETLGQQFVVDNRGGASGVVGTELLAKSSPDGYTIMVQSATHLANAHLYKNLSYDALKDFIGIAPICAQVGMLVVHPSMPVKSVKDIITLAKAKPGEVIYGSSGNGSFVHLTMALLMSMTDSKMTHVPYKGGGPANIAIASGEVQAMIAVSGSIIPQLTAGRVRAIAVTSERRTEAFPDVPTIAESGVPDYEFTAWIGVLAPAGVPKSIVDKLNAEIRNVQRMPDIAEKLKGQTLDPVSMTPEQFAQRLKSDYAKYEKVIKLSGATVE